MQKLFKILVSYLVIATMCGALSAIVVKYLTFNPQVEVILVDNYAFVSEIIETNETSLKNRIEIKNEDNSEELVTNAQNIFNIKPPGNEDTS